MRKEKISVKENAIKTIGKKAAVFALTGMCACAFMMPAGLGAENANAAKKVKRPAKVTGLKAKEVTDHSITLSWNKAKNAKTYKVYQKKNVWSGWKKTSKSKYSKYKKDTKKYKVRKKGGKYSFKVKQKKYKAIRLESRKYNGDASTKKTKAMLDPYYKALTKYTFKVRAFNGKKAGKFSKALTVETKTDGKYTRPGQKVTMTINGKKVQLTVGKVCTVPSFSFIHSSTYVDQVKISKVQDDGDYKDIYGTTTDGKEYSMGTSRIGNDYKCGLDPYNNKYFYIEYQDSPKEYGDSVYTKIKDKDVKIVWTVDNTEPSLDQENATKPGWCLYTVSRNTWMDTDSNEVWGPKMNKTLLKGTYTYDDAKNGKYIYEESDSLYFPRIFWMKVYKGDKLIHEQYGGSAIDHMNNAKAVYDKYVEEHPDETPGELE